MRLATHLAILLTGATFCHAETRRSTVTPQDHDGDGLSDGLESELLSRFAPSFRIAVEDCAGAPVEFSPRSPSPKPTGVRGTIYGQAFPVAIRDSGSSFIELHYYHLWDRDCGRKGHALDVEHVSALLRGGSWAHPPQSWEAVYWYAAAHEKTACDSGNGALASRIGAVARGPEVWVSRGKHASYLDPELCGKGCGGDTCERTAPLRVTALVNIGERGTPMNGAQWTESRAWQFSSKMGSDFTSDAVRAIEASSRPVSFLHSRKAMQSVIAAGNASAEGIAVGSRETGDALATADAHTSRALEKAANSVGTSLRRATRAVRRAVTPNGNDDRP